MAIDTTVTAQQTTITAWGNTILAQAYSALTSLANAGTFHFSGAGTTLSDYMEMYVLTKPSDPSALVIDSPPDVPSIDLPIRPTRPDTTIPDAPVISWTAVPAAPSIEIPTMGTVTLGALLTYVEPNSPVIDFGSLSVDAPTAISITQPTWTFSIDNIMITDDPMVKACMDRLKNNIVYGGTGLSASVEADIWARELERNEQQLEDSTDKVLAMWAKKGFSLPDGLLAHSLSEVQKEYMNRLVDRSREIAIKQAELEQSNLFKSMELTVSLAFKLIEEWIRYEDLVFKAQEATARFANQFIELQIRAHNDVVEVYKARVQAYEIQIRTELAKVEVYKAQIQAALATLQMNEQTVKLYQAQIEAEVVKYKGVLEGGHLLTQIFSEQVRAVLAEAGIEESKIKAYAEQVRAIISKAELYKAEVAGMGAEIEAEKTKIEAAVAQVNAWAKKTDALIAAHGADMEKYKADIQYNVSAAEIYNRAEESRMRIEVEKARVAVAEGEVFSRLVQAQAAISVEAAKGQAAAAASMAAGAMAAVSAHASMSYAETRPLAQGT